MSFIVVQESLGDLLPSRTWKMLIFFFFNSFFFPLFLSLKKRKSRTGRVTVREQEWAESCHRKGEITAIPLHSPTCLLPPPNLSWRQSQVRAAAALLLVPPGSAACSLVTSVIESLQSHCYLWEELAGSLQMNAKNKLLGLPWMSLDGLYCPFSFCPSLWHSSPTPLTSICREQQWVPSSRECSRRHSLCGHGEVQGWGVRPFLREGEEPPVVCVQRWVTWDWTEMHCFSSVPRRVLASL